MKMTNRQKDTEEDLPQVYEAPGALALMAGRSVKDRIWVFLYESMRRDISEGAKEVSIFNEVDFYNLCRGDLIKSKKDKYKSIKAALGKLIDQGDVVKVNIKGEPWTSRDEEPWYHFSMSTTSRGLSDDYLAERQFRMSIDQDKLIIKLYNRSFGTNFTPEQYHGHDPKLLDQPHFLDFIYAAHELIDIFNRTDMHISDKERVKLGMMYPKLTLTYLPGPSFMEKTAKQLAKEYLNTKGGFLFKH